MYSPRIHLADFPELHVEYTELVADLAGALDPPIIWIDYRLTQVERRCTLAHELVHYELGHRGHQMPNVEAVVNAVAAQRLVTFEALLNAARGCVGDWEVAEALHVTPLILSARVSTLTAGERQALWDR